MNVRTTITLVALLILVACYFAFIHRNAPVETTTTPTGAALDEHPLFADDAIPAGQVRKLIFDIDGRTLVYEKSGEQWVQTEPVRFPTQRFAIQDIADAVRRLTYIDEFEPGVSDAPDLASVSLDEPRASITLVTPDGEHTIRLGKRSIAGRSYVQLADAPTVYIVNDALHEAVLGRDPRDWRATTIPAPVPTDADRVELELDGQTIALSKQDGRWRFDDDRAARADAAGVESLVSAARSVQIDSFVADAPENLAIYGLSSPTLCVTMSSPDLTLPAVEGQEPEVKPGEQVTLSIGSPADTEGEKHFATLSINGNDTGVVFTVNAADIDPLRVTLYDLRDPRVVGVATEQVNTLRIDRRDSDTIALRSTDDGYAFADPDPGFEPDQAAALNLFQAIAALRATEFLDDYTPDGAPAISATLEIDEPAATMSFDIYPRDENYIAYNDKEGLAYVLSTEAVNPLFNPIADLRDRDVAVIPAADLTRIELRRAGKQYSFTRDADGDWQLEGYDTFESAALDNLLAALNPLRADSWRAAEDTGESSVELYLRGGDVERVLTIIPQNGRATITAVDEPFTLGEATVALIDREFRDRLVIPLTIDQLTAVTITENDSENTLRRDVNGYYVSDKFGTVDQQLTARMFGALAGLRTDDYIEDPGAAAGIDAGRPFATFTLAAQDGRQIKLDLYRDESQDPPRYYGRVDDADELFVIGQGAIEALGLIEEEAPTDELPPDSPL